VVSPSATKNYTLTISNVYSNEFVAVTNKKLYNHLIYENKKLNHSIIYIKDINTLKNFNNLKFCIVNKNDIQLINSLKKQKIKFMYIDTYYEKYLEKIYIYDLDSTIKDIKPYSYFNYLQKRFIDLLIAIPVLLFSLPVLLYSAYRIKKESPDGPIFYTQKRVTKNKKTFKCYKLRSLRTDVNYRSNTITENDPRLFKWGKFMRRTRIDEIPQLFNVIKGDIHLIGPRAEWIKMVRLHEKNIKHYNLRHINKTGITGYAQVKCPNARDINETQEKFMHELYYIKNWNLFFEFKIIFQTILVILGKKGK